MNFAKGLFVFSNRIWSNSLTRLDKRNDLYVSIKIKFKCFAMYFKQKKNIKDTNIIIIIILLINRYISETKGH